MPNSYTVTPNIVIGNLTVTGKMYVLGNELKVGAAAPYVRLMNLPPNTGGWSVNLQPDYITRDNPALAGLSFEQNVTSRVLLTRTVDPAGNVILADPARIFWSDKGTHPVTGVTGLQTFASKLVNGSEIGPAGSLLLRFAGIAQTSPTGTSQIGVSFGGNNMPVLTIPAAVSVGFWVEALIVNQNNNALQIYTGRGQYANFANVSGPLSYTVDTTLNQTLAATVNNSDAATACTTHSIEGFLLSRTSSF